LAKKIKFLEPHIIKEEVNKLLTKAHKLGFYDYNSPTPLDLIAEKICNLHINYENLDQKLEGVIGLIDPKNNMIWLDSSLDYFESKYLSDEGRHNFTLAHELGHFYLGHLNYAKNSDMIAFYNETDPEIKKAETQANMFAAMLNMPEELVIRKWKSGFNYIANTNEKISAMTEFFRVSKEAMQHRLKTLSLL